MAALDDEIRAFGRFDAVRRVLAVEQRGDSTTRGSVLLAVRNLDFLLFHAEWIRVCAGAYRVYPAFYQPLVRRVCLTATRGYKSADSRDEMRLQFTRAFFPSAPFAILCCKGPETLRGFARVKAIFVPAISRSFGLFISLDRISARSRYFTGNSTRRVTRSIIFRLFSYRETNEK